MKKQTTTAFEPKSARQAWLQQLREEAWERFQALGYPAPHDENWRGTNLTPLAATAFQTARPQPEAALDSPLAGLGCRNRLVFVNGWFSPELSQRGNLPAGVHITNFGDEHAGGAALAAHLGRHARFEQAAFVALNTALFQDGALIEIDRRVELDEPLLVVHLAAPGSEPVAYHPRTLILVGRASRAAVVEVFAGPAGVRYFANAVTEIFVAEGAGLDHYKIQVEGDQAFHIAAVQAVQDRASILNSHNVSLGAALARNDIDSLLDAERAECNLNGLFLASGSQHVDNHTLLDHASPNCSSRELYKGILGGAASAVFNGKIVVRKDAQKTNAIQSNKNLLLSSAATINTKPQLEIFADDVRCTHGATVGQLDREALFYLQSRGIAHRRARNLLIEAFAGELLEKMRWQPLAEALASMLALRLAQEEELK